MARALRKFTLLTCLEEMVNANTSSMRNTQGQAMRIRSRFSAWVRLGLRVAC